MNDSFLFTAASVFFLAWSLILGALSAVTFARDLLPAKTRVDPSTKPRPLNFPPAGSRWAR